MKIPAWIKVIICLILIFVLATFIVSVKNNYDQEKYYKYQKGIEIDTTNIVPL
jgi:hypothetical protein